MEGSSCTDSMSEPFLGKMFPSRSFPGSSIDAESYYVAPNCSSPLSTTPNCSSPLSTSPDCSSPLSTYTSLRDLMPPPAKFWDRRRWRDQPAVQSAYEVPISNVLVRRAALAYLKVSPPAAGSSSEDGQKYSFRRALEKLSDELMIPVTACIGFVRRHFVTPIARAVDMVLEAIRVGP